MKNLPFPHTLVLLIAFIFLAAVLTRLLPAGAYDRQTDDVTGREVVVAGSYHEVEASPVGFFDAIVAIPRGMIDAGDVIFLVFLIGGAFMVVDETQALKKGVAGLSSRLQGRESLIIVIVSLVFAAGGALNNLQEEIVALIPVLLILTNSLGYKPIVAVAMSLGAAMVGAAFSPINPFQVIIAQKISDVPLFSGWAFRLSSMVPALALWIFWTIRYAKRTRTKVSDEDRREINAELDWRSGTILGLVVLTFAAMVYGIFNWGWDFNEMSALFFLMGIAVGLIGQLKLNGTAEAYIRGFREMAFAGLLIGFARAIYLVLDDGQVIDTIVYGLFTPISQLPSQLSAVGMIVAHAGLHVPVPSQSGQAVLTMPLLIPLSDLIGLSRQVTILAYQFGSGLTDIITPTNGALMAVLVAAGVKYDEWFSFIIRKYLWLLALGAVIVVAAIAVGV